MSNLDFARQALHASAAGDTATLSNLLSDDFQFIGATPQPMDKLGFFAFVQALHTAFADFTFHETSASENDDTAAIRHTISGTHTGTFNVPGLPPIPATGRKFTLPEGVSIFTFKDGKATQCLDQAAPDSGLPSILRQLGVQLPG